MPLLEYEEKELMNTDCLKVVGFIANDFFQLPVIKFVLYIHLFVLVVVNLFGIYYFLYVLEKHEIIYYAPGFIAFSYCIFEIVLLYFNGKFKSNIIVNIKEEFFVWKIDSAGQEVKKKIKMEVTLITIFAIVNLLLISLAVFFFMVPIKSDRQLMLAYRIFEDFFPNYKNNILILMYKGTFPLCGYLLGVNCFRYIYYIHHLRFQIYMFTEYCKNIGFFPRFRNEEDLFDDQNYQNAVQKNIKFCIQRHSQFLELHMKKNKQIKVLIAVFSILPWFAGLSVLIFVFSQTFDEEVYARAYFVSAVTASIFLTTIVTGQLLENQQEVSLEIILNEISWYNFNAKNKRSYLTFLTNIMKVRRLSFSDSYAINYKLGLTIVKSIYSAGAVLFKIKY